jgi:hypothetical protein
VFSPLLAYRLGPYAESGCVGIGKVPPGAYAESVAVLIVAPGAYAESVAVLIVAPGAYAESVAVLIVAPGVGVAVAPTDRVVVASTPSTPASNANRTARMSDEAGFIALLKTYRGLLGFPPGVYIGV